VADRGNDRLWRREVDATRSDSGSGSEPGARVHQTLMHQGRRAEVTFVMTDVVPGQRLCFRIHSGIRAHGCFDLRPDGDGTFVEFSVTIELKGDEVMLARYIEQAVARSAEVDLEQLKLVLERSA
ncbi:MAG: SRPBCC family protein, partial [Coriobacteriia bacterium]|nr:SRPBCC family protein [Coriobacteriia bacterium]